MNVYADIAGSIPAEQLTPQVREALARFADENALLRAALNETRARLGEAEAASDADPLTGLANERELYRQLERAVSQAERHATPAALIAIDIKRMRQINERHGRATGDAALAHVARLLNGLIRTSDVAARTGAGFALLLDHLDPDSAIDTGERIARFLAERPFDAGGAEILIQATIGVATILAGDTADDVLERVQRNLERVKEF